MFKKFADFRGKAVFSSTDEAGGAGSDVDYGQLLADLYQEQAQTKYEAKVLIEPAKTDKEVAGY